MLALLVSSAAYGQIGRLQQLRLTRQDVVAARPWSFPASAAPLLYGAAIAASSSAKATAPVAGWPALLFATTAAVSTHAAGNLVNTYVDHVRGDDDASSSDLTLVSGSMKPARVRSLAVAAYGVAAGATAALCATSPAPAPLLLAMSTAGATSAFAYTAGPGLKRRALGDVLIAATFGPLLVGFGYAAQAGSLGGGALLASLPFASHAAAILHANNVRDCEADRAAGVRTLAGALGTAASTRLYELLVLAPFVASSWRAATASALDGLPLLALPAAMRLLRRMRAEAGQPGGLVDLPKQTAKMQLRFAAGLVVGALVPAPSLCWLATSLISSTLGWYFDRLPL